MIPEPAEGQIKNESSNSSSPEENRIAEVTKINVGSEEDLKILTEIEEKVMNQVHLGFDPEVLEILDREETTKSQLESLKERISKEIVIRLFSLGNSIYYGRLRAGKFSSFSEIILRLGMRTSKIYILALSIFFMNPDKEFTSLAARSFIISILAKILAKQMGLKEEDVKNAELGGLFLKVGKVLMMLYQRQRGEPLDAGFNSRYYPYLGLKIVEKFKLPDFLNAILSCPVCSFREDSFSVPGIVQLAHSLVDKSFKKYGKFVLQSPMPDADGLVTSTYGSIIASQLDAVGLGSFLEIVPCLSPRQKLHQARMSIPPT
jgi:hypothetical protein